MTETRGSRTFPPALIVGNRVWSAGGYSNHGPLEGPKVEIAANQGGTIAATQQPYYTVDQLLYAVRWDNGQASKHYAKELFCIGRFQSMADFEKAIQPTGAADVTVGPAGGFRHVRIELDFDGKVQIVELRDKYLWEEFIEPLVRKSGYEVLITKLEQKKAKRKG